MPTASPVQWADGNCKINRSSNDMHLYAYSGFVFSNNAGECGRFDNSGNLQMANDITMVSSSGDMTFRMDNNATNGADFKIMNGAGNSRADFYIDGNNHMTLKGQKVGINKTAPTQALDIVGGILTTSHITVGNTSRDDHSYTYYINDTSPSSGWSVGTDATYGRFQVTEQGVADQFYIKKGGAATFAGNLTISGENYLRVKDSGGSNYIELVRESSFGRVKTNGNPLYLDAAGAVIRVENGDFHVDDGNAIFDQKVGVGTSTFGTSSGSSSYQQLKVSDGTVIADSGGAHTSSQILQNAYVGTDNNNFYTQASWASRIMQTTGAVTFSTASSGSADAQITWSDRLAIANDGDITIGGNIRLNADIKYLSVGASNDYKIHHDTHTYIENTTGELRLYQS